MKQYRKYLYWIFAIHLYLFLVVFFFYHNDAMRQIYRYSVVHIFGSGKTQTEEFKITASRFAENLDPTVYDYIGKRELTFIFEPLITFDEVFNIKPSLATSWGMLSDTKWQFNLRKNVFFHNGSTFNADDVLASFERIKNNPNAVLYEFSKEIVSIEKIDDYTLIITTKKYLPTFLAKMTNFFIIPNENQNSKIGDIKFGTGKYELINKDNNKITLKKFNAHWDENTLFPKTIILQKKANKYARVGGIMAKQANALLDVPPLFFEQIKESYRANLIETTGVKSVFLLFNFNEAFFKNINNRKAFSLAIDRDEMFEVIGKPNKIATQFAGSGIFGFNPNIAKPEYNLEKAKKIIKFNKKRIFNLVLTQENKIFGQFLKTQFDQLGLKLELNLVNSEELVKNLKKGEGDLFLIGWDYSEASVDSFFEAVVSSNGEMNGIGYRNQKIDEKFAKAANELNEKTRLKNLQTAMQIITKEDPIGIPMFDIHNMSAIVPDVYELSFRPDGVAYF